MEFIFYISKAEVHILSILKIRKATIGRTIDLEKSVFLPKVFKDVLSKTGETSILFICDSNAKCIRMFSQTTRSILRFSLVLNASPSLTFLEELNNTLKKNEVKKVYSSGMCIRGQACYYEGYIADPQFISLEKLKSELKNISGVLKVTIEAVM